MSQSYPPFAVFPDLNCVLRLPSGAEYRGKLRQHPSNEVDGEHWYEGYLRAEAKDHVTADTVLKDRFNRDGLRPAHFHPQSNAEPLRVKLNRIPAPKRTEKNAETLIGEVWNHEGLWTVVASPSDSPSLHMAGTVVPSKQELAFEGSRIRQYQPEPSAAEAELPKATPAPRKGKAAGTSARPA
jgi:hypothetical protein